MFPSEEVRIDGDYHYFRIFLNEDRPDLLDSITLAVPILSKLILLPAFESAQFRRFPLFSLNRLQNLAQVDPTKRKLLKGMARKSDRLHGTPAGSVKSGPAFADSIKIAGRHSFHVRPVLPYLEVDFERNSEREGGRHYSEQQLA